MGVVTSISFPNNSGGLIGYFKVKAKSHLDDVELGTVINESDFACLTPNGNFIQLEYIEEINAPRQYDVRPGVWSIQKSMLGLKLDKTSFINDAILESFLSTKNITDKIDCFFNRLDAYKKHGIEIPKRGMLLYGVAGSGKSTSARQAIKKYEQDNETAIIVWATDKIDPFEVKDFIKTFRYLGVKKMILVLEDIGGVEIDQIRMKSTASLLSLLDNQEKTFSIPIFNLATTNHPEVFLGNLTNRPGRFDDKIEVGYPSPSERCALLNFFVKAPVNRNLLEKFQSKKYNEFSPAHILEVVIRSDIHAISMEEAIEAIQKEIEQYKNAFQKRNKLGLGISHDDEGPI